MIILSKENNSFMYMRLDYSAFGSKNNAENANNKKTIPPTIVTTIIKKKLVNYHIVVLNQHLTCSH